MKLHLSIITSAVSLFVFLFVSSFVFASPAHAVLNPPTVFEAVTTQEARPSLGWNHVSGATWYRLYICRVDAAGACITTSNSFKKYKNSTAIWSEDYKIDLWYPAFIYNNPSEGICHNNGGTECKVNGYYSQLADRQFQLIEPGNYKYWVLAYDTQEGNWSATQSWTQAQVETVSEFGHVGYSDTVFNTSWASDPDATWYQVIIGKVNSQGQWEGTVYNKWWPAGNQPNPPFNFPQTHLNCGAGHLYPNNCYLSNEMDAELLNLAATPYIYQMYIKAFSPLNASIPLENIPWGGPYAFTKNPPAIVSNFYPVTYDGEAEEFHATLSWDGVGEADEYRVVIRDSSETEIYNQTLTALDLGCPSYPGVCSINTSAPIISSDTNFSLSVQAIGNNYFNANDPNSWAVNQFQVPEPPEPVGTFYQTSIVQGKMTLSWEAVPDATHYSVFVFKPPLPMMPGCGIGVGGCPPYSDPNRLYSVAELGCSQGGVCTLSGIQQRYYEGEPFFNMNTFAWEVVLGHRDTWDVGIYRYAVKSWKQYSDYEYISNDSWVVSPVEDTVHLPDVQVLSAQVDYGYEASLHPKVVLVFRDLKNQATEYIVQGMGIDGTYQHAGNCNSIGTCTLTLPAGGADPSYGANQTLTLCGNGPSGMEENCSVFQLSVPPPKVIFLDPIISELLFNPEDALYYSDVTLRWSSAPGADLYRAKLEKCDVTGCIMSETNTYGNSICAFGVCSIQDQLEPGHYILWVQSQGDGLCNANDCNLWATDYFVVQPPGMIVNGDREVKVLEVRYFPNGQPMNNHPDELSHQLRMKYNQASNGYLGFNVVNVINRYEPNPQGSTIAERINSVLQDDNLCQVIANQGVDFVWLWTDSNTYFPTIPLTISSQYFNDATVAVGDYCNGQASFYFSSYHFGSSIGLTGASGSIAQRLESVLKLVQGADLVNRYEGMGEYIDTVNCGAPYNPPNGLPYEYDSQAIVSNQCTDWKPDFSGTQTQINCSAWGCTADGYHMWWLSNLPGSQSPVLTYANKAVPSWWDFMYDLEENMQFYWNNKDFYWINESWFASRGFN